ncbi:MAG: hypothetical protein J0I79_16540 [Mesorhizobium sp.]|uniref:hypothetical protein n=1 Tax=Mesorhizobium sp. TaxID=1871066 RepID=UPI001ACB0CA8|nr:hypothetical protein [Mesorhizobium sp.]MBN9219555.1 hypothetical protein [Mesorhizobium sp.]
MNAYFTMNEPLALKPTAADLLADWYWENRGALIRAAVLFVAGAVIAALGVSVI